MLAGIIPKFKMGGPELNITFQDLARAKMAVSLFAVLQI